VRSCGALNESIGDFKSQAPVLTFDENHGAAAIFYEIALQAALWLERLEAGLRPPLLWFL
jgi:hypothetical protein